MVDSRYTTGKLTTDKSEVRLVIWDAYFVSCPAMLACMDIFIAVGQAKIMVVTILKVLLPGIK